MTLRQFEALLVAEAEYRQQIVAANAAAASGAAHCAECAGLGEAEASLAYVQDDLLGYSA